jgi:hypothetical protein
VKRDLWLLDYWVQLTELAIDWMSLKVNGLGQEKSTSEEGKKKA